MKYFNLNGDKLFKRLEGLKLVLETTMIDLGIGMINPCQGKIDHSRQ